MSGSIPRSTGSPAATSSPHRGRAEGAEEPGADEPPPPSPCTRGTRVQGLALGTGQSVTLAPPSSLYVRLAVVEALTGVPESTLRDAR